MMKGYCGKILRVDLTQKRVIREPIPEGFQEAYLGGSGLAAKYFYREMEIGVGALHAKNPLLFFTGPMTGTKVPTSGRHAAASRSPLTGIWGEGDVGGTFGTALKKAGVDGLIITGAAASPVYLFVQDGGLQIRDGQFLWGRDTMEVDDLLKSRLGDQVVTSSIGKGGENLVRFAAIMTDGLDGRAVGRCGLGAVMGSKGLKAIAVEGRGRITAADDPRIREITKGILSQVKKNSKGMTDYGTAVGMTGIEHVGDLPIKNWSLGEWKEGANRLSGQSLAESYLTGRYFCHACIIGCGREVEMDDPTFGQARGAGPEYETLACLGSNCLVDDLAAVVKGNELCNRYGLDTISTGGVIGFAMEAYERGLLTRDDIGFTLHWGDGEGLIQLIHQIAHREGIGDLLAEGVMRAANKLGPLAQEFAVHVKGLELPAHDPRAYNSLAVGYATSSRGACHLQGFSHIYEGSVLPTDLGFKELFHRFTKEGKGELTARAQDLMAVMDSLKMCKFILFGGVGLTEISAWTEAVLGREIYGDLLLKIGERISNLKRLINLRYGKTRKDDTLPPRILTLKRGGGTEDNLPPLHHMLSDYYLYRGWNELGIPTPEKLAELGLQKEGAEYYR